MYVWHVSNALKSMSSTLSLVFEVTWLKFDVPNPNCAPIMLFGIQFLNDLASANSKERQIWQRIVFTSEAKHRQHAVRTLL